MKADAQDETGRGQVNKRKEAGKGKEIPVVVITLCWIRSTLSGRTLLLLRMYVCMYSSHRIVANQLPKFEIKISTEAPLVQQ